MIRKSLRKPSANKCISAKPPKRTPVANIRNELSFHFWVDFTTMLASLAAVVTLVLLLKDRPEQANIAAWTLLQQYLQVDNRVGINEGQGFALQTLVDNGVRIGSINAHNIELENTRLRDADLRAASFQRARLISVDLSNADLNRANLQDALIDHCDLRLAGLAATSLRGAFVNAGDWTGAHLWFADVSDLRIAISPKHAREIFVNACYEKGHAPSIDATFLPPELPQSAMCMVYWGKEWAARDKQAAAHEAVSQPSN